MTPALGAGWLCSLALASQLAPKTAPPAEAELDISHLYGADDVTNRHISYSELRGIADLRRIGGVELLEAHFDGRMRYAWNKLVTSGADITRVYVQYGDESSPITFALGRQTIASVTGAHVDGVSFMSRLGEGAHAGVFGGLVPHPLTGSFGTEFLAAGAGYDVKAKSSNHAGGAFVQWFGGQLDRIYLSERVYFAFGSEWLWFASAVVDLIPPRGLFGDLGETATADQTALERIDLTNGNTSLRFRPGSAIDFTLSADHFHAILPNKWWQDWIASERARLGFAIDGEDPVGTRRSSVRLLANVHVTDALTPYVSGRYDRRHGASAEGYEVKLGLKLDVFGAGYADLNATERRYFESHNRLVSLQVGTSIGDTLNLDAGFTAMHSRPLAGGDSVMLYDASAAAWIELGGISDAFSGVRLLGQYQAFIEPELFYQVFFFRAGYRFGG